MFIDDKTIFDKVKCKNVRKFVIFK